MQQATGSGTMCSSARRCRPLRRVETEARSEFVKKNAKPELTAGWWKSNKPQAWDDNRLEAALAAYDKGRKRLEAEKTEDAFDAAIDLLDQVEKQAAAALKVAGKKHAKGKEPKNYDAEDYVCTAAALNKFATIITEEKETLEDLVDVTIDAETRAQLLGAVKKKKARKFVLITKGAKIVTLVVFKKGPYGPKVLKAKSEGFKGTPTCGVIVGSGVQLNFRLAGNSDVSNAMRTEGNVYDGEPCKISKLKKFLKNAELPFTKAAFEIVTSVAAAVTVDEDANDDEFAGVGEPSAGESIPPPPPLSGTEPPGPSSESAESMSRAVDAATAFKERLTTLLPKIKSAVGTPAGDEAKLKASEAGVFARKQDFDQANVLLDQVERVLDASTGSARDSSPASTENLGVLFNRRLSGLVAKIKAAAGTPAGDGAKLKASEAGVMARNKDFERAGELLDQAEQLLDAPVSETSQPSSEAALAEALEAAQPATLKQAIAAWKSAQNLMVFKLKAIEKIIASSDHPDVARALVELKAVRSQLSGTPDTLQKVQEVEAYLTRDDVVQSVCELADDIRAPLLASTAQLKSILS